MSKPYDLSAWRHHFRPRELRKRPLCEDCLDVGITRPSVELDHITALKDGGALLDPRNVRALCTPCHSRKTIARDGGFGQQQRQQHVHGCGADGVPFELLTERER
mgnify:CR=1 FL=1